MSMFTVLDAQAGACCAPERLPMRQVRVWGHHKTIRPLAVGDVDDANNLIDPEAASYLIPEVPLEDVLGRWFDDHPETSLEDLGGLVNYL